MADTCQAPLRIEARHFNLPPEQFVEVCVAALGCEALVSAQERNELARLLHHGGSRLRMIGLLQTRTGQAVQQPGPKQLLATLRSESDDNLLLDTLLRIAPEDDATFVQYAFRRIMRRQPEPCEWRPLTAALHRDGGRRKMIDRLFELASLGGNAPHCYTLAQALQRAWRPLPDPPAACLLGDGSERQMLLRAVVDDLAPGHWRLDLQLVQPADSRLTVELLGGERLVAQVEIVGGFDGSVAAHLQQPGSLEVRVRGDAKTAPGAAVRGWQLKCIERMRS